MLASACVVLFHRGRCSEWTQRGKSSHHNAHLALTHARTHSYTRACTHTHAHTRSKSKQLTINAKAIFFSGSIKVKQRYPAYQKTRLGVSRLAIQLKLINAFIYKEAAFLVSFLLYRTQSHFFLLCSFPTKTRNHSSSLVSGHREKSGSKWEGRAGTGVGPGNEWYRCLTRKQKS